ncbi:MAG: gamma-glutamylcyclotransferase family protein [Pseudomonadota bacterium]|nr:gamma-glutamylcyclotransferase family protein [Pseudomonadota bacterium]
MATHNVFVYGTLKKGYRYHHWLQGLRGQPAVAPKIDLYAGPHYPFAVRGQGQAQGELYRVTDMVLAQLDQLEGHPHDYHRELTWVIVPHQRQFNAWIYLNAQAYCYPLIQSGCWQPHG